MTDNGLLDGLAKCGVHHCPMVRIGDAYVCVIEYADGLLGMHGITDVIRGTATQPTVLEFDNGHSLPLLCTCCGEPLQIEDGDLFCQEAIGMHVVAIGALLAEGDHADAVEFILAPAEALDDLPHEIVEPLPEGFQALPLHIDSVKRIR